ncbi:GAF and ANTAR domain-containing protein [Saccharothrix longispora]|uniref:Methionine-R-sulfoxide reductase with GAF domain n=1 Tax=Saccharothrix longispora TaxID=33920 RepID=A0ABU1PPP5_9PSEU|nr:GAF and ANTAR domain-containing protein [Saccharothrix longispora]MDR6592608.1 putative methionine-R-sulfoxide reductase with GAF domain [Saccharothrix longispora]
MAVSRKHHGIEPAPAGPDRPGELALRLGDLALYLQDQDSVEATLQGIVDAAVQTVPGAQYAGLSVVRKRTTMSTPVASDRLVDLVDQAQVAFGQGPCVDVLYEKRTVWLRDTSRERRWPRFTARAAELGVRSMLSFQLYVINDDLGALNLYSRHVDAFTEQSEQVGLLFATHAAVAMADAQKIAHLAHTVDNRDLIGQAKGILMERHKLTGDRAFNLLVRASQHTNTKLTDVAQHLVRNGELVEPGTPASTEPDVVTR